VKGLNRRQRFLTIFLVVALILTNLFWGGTYWLNQRRYAQLGELGLFMDVYNSILGRFVEDVSPEKLIDEAVRGMVDSLRDPHSFYLDPNEYDLFMKEVNKSFEGVGMYVGMEEERLTVIAPIEGSPADKAGIKKGDLIIKIDNRETAGLKVDEAVKLITGHEGTKVKLTIERKGQSGPLEFLITRAKINLKTVYGKMVTDKVGYIRITTFAENTQKEFAEVFKELQKSNPQGIVLDLRDNPGGYLEVSVEIADYFVPRGPVVSIKSRQGQEKVYEATGKKYLNLPLAVLINEGSASASEIVAGAVQDLQTGYIVGTKSYGKGSVQSILDLKNGGGIKLTTALYFTPSGRSIQKKGVIPDFVVQLSANPQEDLQLNKAIELVEQKISQ
jgi:carboxyl-terminal processing protease